MSAMLPLCPWRGLRVSATSLGVTEANRRALLFSYAGTTKASSKNPYADVPTKAITNSDIAWRVGDLVNENDLLKLSYDSGNVNLFHQYDGVGQNDRITEVYHIERQMVSQSSYDTHDLTDLTSDMLGYQLPKSFYSIKGFTIYNMGPDTLPLVMNSGSFRTPFGGPTGSIFISSGGCLNITTTGSGWIVDNSNKNIVLGSSVADLTTTYHLVVLGIRPWK